MSNYPRIGRLARYTRWALSLAFLGGALSWAALTWQVIQGPTDATAPATGGHLHVGVGVFNDPAGQLMAVHPALLWGYVTVALGITGYGLVRLWRLTRMYEAGTVFDRQAPAHLSAFAVCMLVRELLDTVALPLLAMATPGATRAADFTINSGTLRVLFITLLFFLMSRIMAAAYVIADDNERII
jgi:hypothetical protein